MILRTRPSVDFDHILDLLVKDGYTVSHPAEYVYEIETDRDGDNHGPHILHEGGEPPQTVPIKNDK